MHNIGNTKYKQRGAMNLPKSIYESDSPDQAPALAPIAAMIAGSIAEINAGRMRLPVRHRRSDQLRQAETALMQFLPPEG